MRLISSVMAVSEKACVLSWDGSSPLSMPVLGREVAPVSGRDVEVPKGVSGTCTPPTTLFEPSSTMDTYESTDSASMNGFSSNSNLSPSHCLRASCSCRNSRSSEIFSR